MVQKSQGNSWVAASRLRPRPGGSGGQFPLSGVERHLQPLVVAGAAALQQRRHQVIVARAGEGADRHIGWVMPAVDGR
jgi:hypothetical protein